MAREDTFPAGSVAGAGGIIGSANRDAGDRRLQPAAALTRLQRAFVKRFRVLHERDADQSRSGLDRNPKLRRRIAAAPASARRAEGNQALALAIDIEFQLLRFADVARKINLNLVLRIQRKVTSNGNSSARSERQSLDMRVLRLFQRQREYVHHHRHGGVADRHAADLPGRIEITLHHYRRDIQQIRDVIEAAGRVIRRQQKRVIHFLRQIIQAKQVANGVSVFGTRQAVKVWQFTGIWVGRCRVVDPGFEVRRHFFVSCLIGAGHPNRRHGFRPELPNHFLPEIGVPGWVEVRRIDNDPACFQGGVVACHTVLADRRAGRSSRRIFLLRTAGEKREQQQDRRQPSRSVFSAFAPRHWMHYM